VAKRSWLDRRKKTEKEIPYQSPIWLGDHSNGEFYHRQTAAERKMNEIILKEGAERARYYGMDRREFMASGVGIAFAMSVMNMVNGCSGKDGGMDPTNAAGAGGMPGVNPGTGGTIGAPRAGGAANNMTMAMQAQAGRNAATGTGMNPQMMNPMTGVGPGDVPTMGGSSGAGGSSTAGSMSGPGDMPDPKECETMLRYDEMFIFDVQTHRVERTNETYSAFLSILPQAACGKGVPGCYTREEYTRVFFLDSDTTMTVLSGIPAVDGQNPLTNEEIAMTRDYIHGIAQDTQRVITHSMVLPNYNHDMSIARMDELIMKHAPIGAWKCYTPWGPGNGVTGFWLDDPMTGLPMIENGRKLGLKNFCCHKGLPLPGFDNNYGDPKDIGVVASMFPDCNWIVYHSAFQYGNADETQGYTMGNKDGVNSLVTAMMMNGLGVGSNIYAELGTTWESVRSNYAAATHILGKLLKYVGEDNIVWGTDCMWYGPPQEQITTFMSFKMDESIRMAEGYPDLTPEIKTKIMGLNAAKVFGVDPVATRCGVKETDLAMLKRDYDSEFGRFRWVFNRPEMTTRRQFFQNAAFHRAAKMPG
jgi:uncharacterized protein